MKNDEQLMIREQERLAKVAKRKKRKKWRILALVLGLLLIITCVWYFGWGKEMIAANTAAVTVKIEKNAGQNVVYARVDAIYGNEITYTIAEEVKTEGTSSDREKKPVQSPEDESQSGRAPGGFSGMPDMSQIPSFGGNSGGNSQGGFSGMPGMSQMPDMSQRPNMGQMQGGFGNMGGMQSGMTSNSTDSGMLVYDGKTYRFGSESFTKYIPVGTDVTTKLGTVTTFSRLAAGDYVALVMEKDGNEDVIVAVYIIG